MPERLANDNTTRDIRARVREVVCALAPNPLERVDSSVRLEADLQFDSLALVELAVRLEETFELPDFQDEALDLKIETLGDVEDLIEDLLRRGRP